MRFSSSRPIRILWAEGLSVDDPSRRFGVSGSGPVRGVDPLRCIEALDLEPLRGDACPMLHDQEKEIEAAAFRRLVAHLQGRSDVQNIDLMNLADFCRNCLAKWMVEEAHGLGLELDYEIARERVYGMPYEQWKKLHQRPATAEQLAKFAKKDG